MAFSLGILLLLLERSSGQVPIGHLKTDPASEVPRPFSASVGANRQLKTDPEIGEGYSFQLATPVNSASSTTVLPNSSFNASVNGINSNQVASFTENQQQLNANLATDALSRELNNRRRSLPHLKDSAEIEQSRQRIVELERLLKIAPKEGSTMPMDTPGADVSIAAPAREAQDDNLSVSRTDFNNNSIGYPPAAFATAYSGPGYYPAGAAYAPYDWTAGIRNSPANAYPPNLPVQAVPGTTVSGFGPSFVGPSAFGFGPLGPVAAPEAIAISRAGLGTSNYTTSQIYHQPLIQIKLRVIEVARANGTFSNSILEYVSQANTAGNASLTSGSPLNGNTNAALPGFQNLRGISRFTVPGLVSNSTTGSGILVNLTSEHINWVASFLATELKADVVTAPEVVTLNGQNVEFLAGEKVAFELGQNVVTGVNNNIQQLFYKHVGTMVSVTPRIVNWGLYGEGDGEAPLTSQDIADWNLLCEWMVRHLDIDNVPIPDGRTNGAHPLSDYIGPTAKPVPLSIRSAILQRLGDFSRRELIHLGFPMQQICTEDTCRWTPENCTIDLSLVVRLSDSKNIAVDPAKATTGSTGETNVRAVANVVQLKSGNGVVMAGLIGERENEESTKIPGLGDIPYVGSLFRSRSKTRLKTEVLIFVEARVVDSQPEVARYQSAEDYRLSQPFLRDNLLDNPLECCLQRSGVAPYACDCGLNEREFWQIHGREIRQAKRHLNDIFR